MTSVSNENNKSFISITQASTVQQANMSSNIAEHDILTSSVCLQLNTIQSQQNDQKQVQPNTMLIQDEKDIQILKQKVQRSFAIKTLKRLEQTNYFIIQFCKLKNCSVVISLDVVMKSQKINEEVLKFIMENKIEIVQRNKNDQNNTLTMTDKISSDEQDESQTLRIKFSDINNI